MIKNDDGEFAKPQFTRRLIDSVPVHNAQVVIDDQWNHYAKLGDTGGHLLDLDGILLAHTALSLGDAFNGDISNVKPGKQIIAACRLVRFDHRQFGKVLPAFLRFSAKCRLNAYGRRQRKFGWGLMMGHVGDFLYLMIERHA